MQLDINDELQTYLKNKNTCNQDTCKGMCEGIFSSRSPGSINPAQMKLQRIHKYRVSKYVNRYPFASQSPTTKVDSAAFFSFSPVGASYPDSLVWIDPSELSEVRWSHTAKTAHQLPSKEGCPCSRSLVLRVEWVGEKDK